MRRRVVFTITVARLACDYRPSPVFSILTTLKKSGHGQHSAAVGVTSRFNPALPEAKLSPVKSHLPHAIINLPMPTAQRGTGRCAEADRAVIEAFLKSCKQPALLEPGEELLILTPDNFSLELRGSLAQACPAVGAFGDIRAHLLAAALAYNAQLRGTHRLRG